MLFFLSGRELVLELVDAVACQLQFSDGVLPVLLNLSQVSLQCVDVLLSSLDQFFELSDFARSAF